MKEENEESENIQMKIEFDEIVNKELKIVKLFNSLYQACYKENYREFKIQEDEKLIIFQLLKDKLKFLGQAIKEKENNSDNMLKINLFNALFMDEKDFSIDDLDIKASYFNIIIKMMEYGDPEEENEKEILKNLDKEMNNSIFNKLFSQFDLCDDYELVYYPICLYLIFKYSKLKSLFVNSIIIYSNIEFEMVNGTTKDFDVRKNYEEEMIEAIPKNQLIDDLSSIYKIIDNYTILYIEKNSLKLRKMSNEEINKEIKEITQKKNKRRNKKNVNIEINKKNENAKEKKPENIFFDSAKNINNNSKIEDKLEEESIEKKIQSQIIKENKIKQDYSVNNPKKETSLDPIIAELCKNIKTQNENQNKKIEDLQRKVETLEHYQRKVETQEKTIKNLKNNLEDLSQKSIKFEFELRLIQARDAIKNIIDLFSKALGMRQDITYNDKIFIIKKKIIKSQIKGLENNKDLAIFLDKIYRYLNFSNRNAHSLNLDQPILDQIFDYIEPDNKLKELKKRMKEGKMNDLLKDLAKTREKYFNNKYKLIEEERKIIDKVKGMEDLIK